jgi:hypothetical protein
VVRADQAEIHARLSVVRLVLSLRRASANCSADRRERSGDLAAKRGDGANDDHRNQRDEQRVLRRVLALLILGQVGGDAGGEPGLQKGQHVLFSL